MRDPKPEIGDVVIYERHGSPNGQHKAEPSPAIITKVLDDLKCQLFVMNPNGVYFDTCDFNNEPKPGHWRWKD